MSELSPNAKKVIEEHLERYPSKQAVTLPALHVVQEERGCVSNKAMQEIAEILELSPAQIHDTMSFYGFFRTEEDPLGKVRVWICRSLPCMLRGVKNCSPSFVSDGASSLAKRPPMDKSPWS